MLRHRREKIIFARIEHRNVGGRAGRDDADHFAAHDFLARSGLLHLVADGDLETRADQARNVTFRGVVRHAAHRNGLALFPVARGQRNLKFSRGNDGVFIKKLVEIAQPKQQQRVRIPRLHALILLH